MDNWLSSLTAWILGLVKSVFTFLVTLFHDVSLWFFDGILVALAGLITAIPVPSFLQTGINVGSILSVLPPFSLYLLQQLNISGCIAVISAGIMFRLTRKAFTLGQW